ncbi:MAG: hypothetical protein HGA44_20180 [Cellulomonadaceae bacterium]|nr:hypothetical protein [Cellulomonadaceae bacterium]
MVDLSKLFTEQQASEIDWNGPLFSLYELPSEVSQLTVRFRARASGRRQGIRLKIRGGEFEANGVLATDLVVWQDASPEKFDVQVRWKANAARSLRVWNCWEVNGVMHAWLGNAGMRVEQVSPSSLILKCSDGHGEPSFDDLVVGISSE